MVARCGVSVVSISNDVESGSVVAIVREVVVRVVAVVGAVIDATVSWLFAAAMCSS